MERSETQHSNTPPLQYSNTGRLLILVAGGCLYFTGIGII